MATLFLTGNRKLSLKYGSLYVEPSMRRENIRRMAKGLTEWKEKVKQDKFPQLVSHKISVKHLNHVFFDSTEGKITGPALAFLGKVGIPVSYLEKGLIAFEFIPIVAHGSPEARQRQVLDPPKLAPWKHKSFVKSKIRKLRYLVDKSELEPLISITEGMTAKEICKRFKHLRDSLLKTTKINPIEKFLEEDPPPTYYPPKLREGLSILRATVSYQISVSGLIPLAGGYVSNLIDDLTAELEDAVVFSNYVKDHRTLRHKTLELIDDRDLALRQRILKASMTYAKFCKSHEVVESAGLIRIPRRLST